MQENKNMRNNFLFLLFFILSNSTSVAYGQDVEKKNPKGQLYFLWGYNKDWFSLSDLHFESTNSNDFDFTIYGAKAHDKPRFESVLNRNISIPQFIYRIGYMFSKHPNMGIEIGFDHAKYIMNQNQVARVKGKIFENYIDKDTVLANNFVRFEHTNGANFLMASFIYRKNIYASPSGSNCFYAALKPGAGIVIPQSEVALFGKNQNNNYHIAGYVTGMDISGRYEFRKHFIAETGFKGVFANYLDVLSVGESKANHHFFCVEWLFSIGYQIAL